MFKILPSDKTNKMNKMNTEYFVPKKTSKDIQIAKHILLFFLLVFISACGGGSNTTPRPIDVDPPIVLKTAPASEAQVTLNANISVTFNESMSSVISSDKVTIVPIGTDGLSTTGKIMKIKSTDITVDSSEQDKVINITLENLSPQDVLVANMQYRITINGIKDYAGNPMAKACEWIFSTSSAVIKTKGKTGVCTTNPPLVVPDAPSKLVAKSTFDANIVLNWETAMTGIPDHYSISSSSDKRLSFQILDANYAGNLTTYTDLKPNPGTSYIYKISAFDLKGVESSPVYSSPTIATIDNIVPFVTETIPASLVQVATNTTKSIKIKFNEPIVDILPSDITVTPLDATGLPDSANTVIINNTDITLSNSKNVVTVNLPDRVTNPSAPLRPDTIYEVTLSNVTDLAGNTMSGNCAWQFSTKNTSITTGNTGVCSTVIVKQPLNFSAIATIDGKVNLKWDKVTIDVPDHYRIEYSTDNKITFQILEASYKANTASYTHSKPVLGISYIYKITAITALSKKSTPALSIAVIPAIDTKAPKVISTIPASLAEILHDTFKSIVVNFNEAIIIPKITDISIYPLDNTGLPDTLNQIIIAQSDLLLNNDNSTLTINLPTRTNPPLTSLLPNTKYEVTVSNIADSVGNKMLIACKWYFATLNSVITTGNPGVCNTL